MTSFWTERPLILLSLLIALMTGLPLQARVLVASVEAPRDSFHGTALEVMNQRLETVTQGALQIRGHYLEDPRFPAIRGEEDNVNMVMSGLPVADSGFPVDITIVAVGNAAAKIEVLDILQLPYLFDDRREAETLLAAPLMTRQVVEQVAREHKVRILGWLIGGFRHLTNRVRPVEQLADLQGLRIRVPLNRIMHDTYAALGATVVPVPWGETFAELQEGRVDGQENPTAAIIEARFWEAGQRYLTNTDPFLYLAPILMNETRYQSMPEDLRVSLALAATEGAAAANRWAVTREQAFVEELQARGVEFSRIRDRELWWKATAGIRRQYAGRSDERRRLLEQVLEITRPMQPR